jgi:hypothetical protein
MIDSKDMAGILDQITKIQGRSVFVNNAAVFYAGQIVRVMDKDWGNLGHTLILSVYPKTRRLHLGKMVNGMAVGDYLAVEIRI